MERNPELLPNPTDAGTTADAAQYGSDTGSGPEPTPSHRGYVANHGETYRPGSRVRVRVHVLARDPRNGETGTVQRNYNDGGEMIHVLRFEDGSTAKYHYDDLVPANR